MDPRFAKIKNDPRFRRPQRQRNKLEVDKRFKSVFKQSSRDKINKYGQPVASNAENLSRFYHLNDKPDYARGEVLLQSSDEEEQEDTEDSDPDDEDSEEDEDEVIILGDQDQINLDEDHLAHLDAQAEAYSAKYPQTSHPEGERTSRIAVVNLDWDHVRANHLYKVFSSLLSLTAPPFHRPSNDNSSRKTSKLVQGSILDVTIYPSDYGKENLAKEEKEGPPAHLFEHASSSQSEINQKTVYQLGGEEDVNPDALRLYQLERLRYYYAIVSCSSVDAAMHCYTELDGTEFERSANVFDLSFVPDDLTFEDEFKDRAISETDTYKPLEFTTDALRHSKVKLTWDEDDTERSQFTKRPLSKHDIENNDFTAYLASESESEPEPNSNSRDKMRALLLGGNDDNIPEGWNQGDSENKEDRDVNMQVTFSSGLSNVPKNPDEDTTLDMYKRKMKEKRNKRKEDRGVKNDAPGPSSAGDAFFGSDDSDDDVRPTSKTTPVQSVPADRSVATKDDLARLISDDTAQGAKHFDLSAVIKAEKSGNIKSKKRKQRLQNLEETQGDFAIDVADSRFTALHEDHDFAIDPSNPHFKKTNAMSALLDERSKRQVGKRHRESSPSHQEDLNDLVNNIKKHGTQPERGPSKRRRR